MADGPAGIVPATRGFNASINTTSQHDSSNGWSSLLTPDVAYRFSNRLSFDAAIPVYDYILVDENKGTRAKPVLVPVVKHHALGDTALNGHLQFAPDLLTYEFSATLGLPTGNSKDGLGAGQVTYSINNHFERSYSIFTPDIELGIGDSSALDQTRSRKSYVSTGELAYFQAGISLELPRNASFSTDAYEELPVSAQSLFSTTTRGRRKAGNTSTAKGPAEDNGFENSLDIPLSGHVTLSGFYTRSLRAHIDTAGFSLTFLLKAPPREH